MKRIIYGSVGERLSKPRLLSTKVKGVLARLVKRGVHLICERKCYDVKELFFRYPKILTPYGKHGEIKWSSLKEARQGILVFLSQGHFNRGCVNFCQELPVARWVLLWPADLVVWSLVYHGNH